MSNVRWGESQLTPKTTFQQNCLKNKIERIKEKLVFLCDRVENPVKICSQSQIKNTMADTLCIGESDLLPYLEDDLLDAEVSALFHNYLQMSEVRRLFITLPYLLSGYRWTCETVVYALTAQIVAQPPAPYSHSHHLNDLFGPTPSGSCLRLIEILPPTFFTWRRQG